ncbi:hypothetical protein Fmac_023479 [Flemingia macrophylla]|uniref:Uncharacterized protein n=1 Tax=Flemingia macrophylla TaxID=520843 RepID=A0ABD1LLQ3_9FABA
MTVIRRTTHGNYEPPPHVKKDIQDAMFVEIVNRGVAGDNKNGRHTLSLSIPISSLCLTIATLLFCHRNSSFRVLRLGLFMTFDWIRGLKELGAAQDVEKLLKNQKESYFVNAEAEPKAPFIGAFVFNFEGFLLNNCCLEIPSREKDNKNHTTLAS